MAQIEQPTMTSILSRLMLVRRDASVQFKVLESAGYGDSLEVRVTTKYRDWCFRHPLPPVANDDEPARTFLSEQAIRQISDALTELGID